MFAWLESASIDCARLIRGIASNANAGRAARGDRRDRPTWVQRRQKPDQHRLGVETGDLLLGRRRDLDDDLRAERLGPGADSVAPDAS